MSNASLSKLSDREWGAFRRWLKTRARQKDADDIFTSRYTASRLTVAQAIDMYDAGRKHELPQDWNALWDEYQLKTQDPEYRLYLRLHARYSLKRKRIVTTSEQ